ncbi:GNAT family N-acetyltransferase [Psychromicrobium xiongbiense]|uniref:bifunctional acetate--CoA ligase family protein/GNAT family N-acetyltransferase n=1 Tax=Psychromicrobium xiongbiense TaxID=3051184 RepID=UPI002555F481|nr:GNAT family N-acetyltransferase [Psychromicrobium sp. YIM S02556]
MVDRGADGGTAALNAAGAANSTADGAVGYPHHWEADVVLRDGATAHLRPIARQDAQALQDLHRSQSEDSVYMRFFTYKSVLSDRELRRFTQVDYHDRVALVITVAGSIIGVGRYDRLDDPQVAEVAFNISDAHQGRGLGSILLEHLAAAARENGIVRFSAEVLPGNRKMLTVFSEAGYEVNRHFDDGVVSLSFDLDPTEKSRAVRESREHRAEARSVAGLLAPRSVAVLGPGAASSAGAPGSATLAAELVRQVHQGGYRGIVQVIDPLAVEGPRSMSELAEPVDLVLIAVEYDDVERAVADCAGAGARGALVFSGGFADDGERGLERQHALVRLARSSGMRLIGPASLGLIRTDPDISLNASRLPGLPPAGTLGVFTQSAALGTAVYASLRQRGMGLSTFVSAGNRADISGNDLMQFWEDDPQTAVCALYLESIGNPRKFSRLARRLARTKPVIVAKSEALGLSLPAGHAVRASQALPGTLDAMLRQSGVIRVDSTEELADLAQLAVAQPLPAGRGMAVVSNSRALARVVADSAAAHGFRVEREDIVTEPDPARRLCALADGLTAVMAEGSVDSVVVTLMAEADLVMVDVAEVLTRVGAVSGKPVVLTVSGMTEADAPRAELMSTGHGGLPVYLSPQQAIAALSGLARYRRWLDRDQGTFEGVPGLELDKAQALVSGWLQGLAGENLQQLTPAQVAELLACIGVDVLESVPFQSADEAVQAARRLGWPVVLKTMDQTLRHRLDLGGVRINIADEDSLRNNITQMRASLAAWGEFDLEVQAMAPLGQSCTLRGMEDPLLGPVVSFGMTGDAINLLQDWAHRVPPLSSSDVAELIRAPKAAAKLFGYQGLPAVNITALEDLVSRFAALKEALPEVAVIEFTPVLVSEEGATVLAASIQLGNPDQRIDSARRALTGWFQAPVGSPARKEQPGRSSKRHRA